MVLLLLVVTRSSLHPTFWILREQEVQHCSSACTSVLSQNLKELKHYCIRMNSSEALSIQDFENLPCYPFTEMAKLLRSFLKRGEKNIPHTFRFTTIFLAYN